MVKASTWGLASAVDLGDGVGDGGTVGVEKVLLGLPVGVPGVTGVVDVGQVGGGGIVGHGRALVIVDLDQSLIGVGRSGVGGKLGAAGQNGVDVGACIGHFTELHSALILLPVPRGCMDVSSFRIP